MSKNLVSLSAFLALATAAGCDDDDSTGKSLQVQAPAVIPADFAADPAESDAAQKGVDGVLDGVVDAAAGPLAWKPQTATATATITATATSTAASFALQGGVYVDIPDEHDLTVGSDCAMLADRIAMQIQSLKLKIATASAMTKQNATASQPGAQPWYTSEPVATPDKRFAYHVRFTRREPTAEEKAGPAASILRILPQTFEIALGATATKAAAELVTNLSVDASQLGEAQNSGGITLGSITAVVDEQLYGDAEAKRLDYAYSSVATAATSRGTGTTAASGKFVLQAGDTPRFTVDTSTQMEMSGQNMTTSGSFTLSRDAAGTLTLQVRSNDTRGTFEATRTITLDNGRCILR